MTKHHTKVVVDTNIWISYMLGGLAYKQLQAILLSQKIILLISEKQKEEIIRIVRSSKFSNLFSAQQIDDLIYILNYRTRLIQVISQVRICRDKNDDFLFSLCKDGNADFLISGDADVLEITNFKSTQVVALKNFKL